MRQKSSLLLLVLALTVPGPRAQIVRTLGRFQEVFAWKQVIFNINGNMVLEDRFGEDFGEEVENARERLKRQADNVFFNNNQEEPERNWDRKYYTGNAQQSIDSWQSPWSNNNNNNNKRPTSAQLSVDPSWQSTWSNNNNRPEQAFTSRPSTTTDRPRNYPSSAQQSVDPSWQSQWSNNKNNNNNRPEQASTRRPSTSTTTERPRRPSEATRRPTSTTTTARPADDASAFFIQYNNLPMGVERVGDRLFVTLPRRRYGIPSTLNYLDLTRDSNQRSPGFRPYPDLRSSRALTSVYRTRADECNRLWMVDTGMLEIPDNRQQVQPPAIVAYNLNTNQQILRYPFKSSDLVSELTPTGLASITIDIINGDCAGAYAYVPDLATYGLIVYSLRDNDSWRLSHNYFHFNPIAGHMSISGLRFSWNDGIFSVTLTSPGMDGCRTAYFHPMVGTHEFSVSTCSLKNRTASTQSDFYTLFSMVGDRGVDSQSTMHGYHPSTQVVFFANIGRDAVTCWNTGTTLSPTSTEILARDSARMSYPSDLHVTGDEVWVMANSLPTWAYSRLDTNEYNFYIYKANVQDLISGTVCGGTSSRPNSRNQQNNV